MSGSVIIDVTVSSSPVQAIDVVQLDSSVHQKTGETIMSDKPEPQPEPQPDPPPPPPPPPEEIPPGKEA